MKNQSDALFPGHIQGGYKHWYFCHLLKFKTMRTLTLHHPTGHPYWSKNEYTVQMPNGNFLDLTPFFNFNGNYGGYEIFVKNGDVFFVQCDCGSGLGKIRIGEIKKIIDKAEYDKIEFAGRELTIPDSLKFELAESGFC
jgi:hypothetical protein